MPDQSLLSTVRSDLADERGPARSPRSRRSSPIGERVRFDDNFADSGQVAAEQGENKVLAVNQLRGELDEVERALAKLDDGTYGKCETCGEAIAEARLEAIPAPHVTASSARSPLARPRAGPPGPALLRVPAPGWPRRRRRGPGSRPACSRASSRCGDGCPARSRRHAVGVASGWSGRWATRPPVRCWRPRCCTTSARSRAASAPTGASSPPCRRGRRRRDGHDVAQAAGFARRVGLYLQHDEIGGDLARGGRQRSAHRRRRVSTTAPSPTGPSPRHRQRPQGRRRRLAVPALEPASTAGRPLEQ